MILNKKIVFVTGTRADYGKIKSLIEISIQHENFEVYVFVTGMHLEAKYGFTLNEIKKNSMIRNIHPFINSDSEGKMDKMLSNTITGFSQFIEQINPDLIIVHGDRIEPLAAAIVGSLNNILVAHIEGGERSGTIDEMIRHSISKLSHIHFTSNETSTNRLIKMGENPESIYEIGSPDMDFLLSNDLPPLGEVLSYYDILFDKYIISLYHPVTTEYQETKKNAHDYFSALEKSGENVIVIYPNNDHGSKEIIEIIEKYRNLKRFRIFPSIRFEFFLTLLKNSDLIVGNSSAGIREAPYVKVPTVNVGSRQSGRFLTDSIVNCSNEEKDILKSIQMAKSIISTKDKVQREIMDFGKGDSAQLFINRLKDSKFWKTAIQKEFYE